MNYEIIDDPPQYLNDRIEGSDVMMDKNYYSFVNVCSGGGSGDSIANENKANDSNYRDDQLSDLAVEFLPYSYTSGNCGSLNAHKSNAHP